MEQDVEWKVHRLTRITDGFQEWPNVALGLEDEEGHAGHHH